MKVTTASKQGDEYTVGVGVNGVEIRFCYNPVTVVWSTIYPEGKSLADFKRSTFIKAKKLAKEKMLELSH